MKKYLTTLFLLLTACTPSMWQMKTDCKLSNDELFKKITAVLLQERFIIKASEEKLGYLQAESLPEYVPAFGLKETHYWTFQSINGTITASASWATQGGQSSSVTYMNDGTAAKIKWYWNVRNALESLCGNKLTFIEIAN